MKSGNALELPLSRISLNTRLVYICAEVDYRISIPLLDLSRRDGLVVFRWIANFTTGWLEMVQILTGAIYM